MRPQKGARLVSSIPDDSVETYEEILVQGGKAVVGAIGELLARAGYVTSEPIYEGDKGWDITVDTPGRRFVVLVLAMRSWNFLLAIDDTGFLDRTFKKGESYAEFLTKLNALLRDDPRFEKIEWFKDPGDAFDEEMSGDPEPVLT